MPRLLQLYRPEAAASWLVGLNPSLHDRRPIDPIRLGRIGEVLDAIANEPRAGLP